MTHDEIEVIAVKCRLELERMGVTIRVVHDLNEVRELYERLDKPLSPAANQQRLLLTEKNCFSIFGFEGDEPVLGFVIRVDDLGSEDAQSFLPRSIETIFGVKITGASSDVYAGRNWGRAGYFGDLKTAKRTGMGPTGKKILRLAIAYAHYRAFTDYATTTHYCFLRGSDVRNGVPYGFFEAGPYVWTSDRDLYADGSPEWIMQLSVSRLPDLMASVHNLLPELLAVDQKPRLEVVTKDSAGSA